MVILCYRTKYSLNEIAEQATVQLIQSVLDKNIRVTEIYVDTVGPPEKYEVDHLMQLMNLILLIKNVCHKDPN